MNENFIHFQQPDIQFISCEDKAMNFYEKLLEKEEDPSVRKELIKAYSDLILKRIDLNILYAKNTHEFNLTQMKINGEIAKLDREYHIKALSSNKL